MSPPSSVETFHVLIFMSHVLSGPEIVVAEGFFAVDETNDEVRFYYE